MSEDPNHLGETGRHLAVIVTGTDPSSKSGGIGVVLPGYLQAIEASGLGCICIPTYHPTRPGGKWLLWLRAIPQIMRSVREARRRGITPVVYSHAGAAPSMVREALVLRAARLAGARTIMQLHASHLDAYLEGRLRTALLRLLLSRIDVLCVLTDWWRRRLCAVGLHPRVEVIPNPLLPEQESVAARATSREMPVDGPITVLSLARLVEGKGIDVAISALEFLPQRVRLVIGGDGPLLDSLVQLADSLGVRSRVTFRGWIAGEAKHELLAGAHVFCLPSTKDSFPIAMVEAMSHGIPIVAVHWGGIPDVVPNGRAGLLTDGPVPQQIAAAVWRLIEDRQMYRSMSAAGKLCALELCSPHVVSARLGALFSSLAGSRIDG